MGLFFYTLEIPLYLPNDAVDCFQESVGILRLRFDRFRQVPHGFELQLQQLCKVFAVDDKSESFFLRRDKSDFVGVYPVAHVPRHMLRRRP